jgi:hypothetical protein
VQVMVMFRRGIGVGLELLVLCGLACSSTEAEDSGSGGADSGASGALASEATRPEPLSVWDPKLPTAGSFCSMLVAVECDGNEDCPDGLTCCGTVNGGSFSYDSVGCQEKCDRADGGRMLCHPGEACPDPEEECLRSLILPSYLSVCGTRSAFTPEGFEGVSEASGEINCAPGRVCTGGEVCCALSSWSATTQTAVFVDGRCAPSTETCSCSGGSVPIEPTTVANDGGG